MRLCHDYKEVVVVVVVVVIIEERLSARDPTPHFSSALLCAPFSSFFLLFLLSFLFLSMCLAHLPIEQLCLSLSLSLSLSPQLARARDQKPSLKPNQKWVDTI